MSLCRIFTICQDGKIYENLTYGSKTGVFFLCFDDDEPPELVIKKPGPMPYSILKMLGFNENAFELDRRICGMRSFLYKMHDAEAYFLTLLPAFDGWPAPRRDRDTWDRTYNSREEIMGGLVYGEEN